MNDEINYAHDLSWRKARFQIARELDNRIQVGLISPSRKLDDISPPKESE